MRPIFVALSLAVIASADSDFYTRDAEYSLYFNQLEARTAYPDALDDGYLDQFGARSAYADPYHDTYSRHHEPRNAAYLDALYSIYARSAYPVEDHLYTRGGSGSKTSKTDKVVNFANKFSKTPFEQDLIANGIDPPVLGSGVLNKLADKGKSIVADRKAKKIQGVMNKQPEVPAGPSPKAGPSEPSGGNSAADYYTGDWETPAPSEMWKSTLGSEANPARGAPKQKKVRPTTKLDQVQH